MVKVIGVTGGAGAGKTTLVGRLKRVGIPVITADEVGRQVVQKGKPVLRALMATFGHTILTSDGQLNRQKFGQWVFRNPKALQRLNHLTHPKMCTIIEVKVRELKNQGRPLIGVEAAVLFEMGLQRCVNEVWSVVASKRERIKRLEKLGQKRADILVRMHCQLPTEVFINRAHRVIVTDRRRQIQVKVSDRKTNGEVIL